LVNLLRNAREAIQDEAEGRGAVRVTFADGPEAVLRVEDSGPGIPERARETLFQPFVGSGRKGGTGLGLAVSRELAQGHGGDLVLADGNRGAAFDLRLPQPERPIHAPGPELASAQAGGGGDSGHAPGPRAGGQRRSRTSRRAP
jgi:signal transduction histidine kinase